MMRPAGYNEIRRVTQRYMVGLVDHKGDGVYNVEYASIAPDGTVLRTWREAKEKLPKEYRQALWPEMLRALAGLLTAVGPGKLMRKLPVGDELNARFHQVAAVLTVLGYTLDKTGTEGDCAYWIYKRG